MTTNFNLYLAMITPILLAEVNSQDYGAAAAKGVSDRDKKVPQGNTKHAYFFFKGLAIEKEARSVEDPSCYSRQ